MAEEISIKVQMETFGTGAEMVALSTTTIEIYPKSFTPKITLYFCSRNDY